MDSDPLLLRNQLCFPLYLCSKEIIKKYTPFLKELNLTYTQYIVMMYFWEKEKSNVKELSKITLIDPGTLTPLLKKLENKGYITRSKSSMDERNLEVKITDKGKKLKEKAISIPRKMLKCIDLSDDEIITLYQLINKALINVVRK